MKEHMNAFEIYELDKDYDFATAPTYNKPLKKSNAYKQILEMLNEDKFTELSEDYQVEILPGVAVVTTQPKLYKYEIGDKVFSDIFYELKVIQHRGDISFTTVYLNYHGFDGNEGIMNEHFLVEKAITLFGDMKKEDHNMFFDPNGGIIMQVKKGDEHSSKLYTAALANAGR